MEDLDNIPINNKDITDEIARWRHYIGQTLDLFRSHPTVERI